MVQSPACSRRSCGRNCAISAAPCGRVHDFEMELRGVEAALLVGDHGDRRVGRGADRGKAGRQLGDAVAVAHPHRIALADLPDAVGAAPTASSPRPRRGRIRDGGRPRPCRRAGAPWPARRSRCRAPARRPRRSPSARSGASFVEHRGRTAGEDDRLSAASRGKRGFGLLERHDLAIDLLLAHPPRDELGDLRAEIDDEDFVVRGDWAYDAAVIGAGQERGVQSIMPNGAARRQKTRRCRSGAASSASPRPT